MKNFWLILLLFCASNSYGNGLYNKLENLYKKDKTACLELVKKHIKAKSDNGAPYYFASLIYSKKYQKSTGIKSKYLNLKKGVFYGVKFQAINDKELLVKTNWNVKMKYLTEQSNLLINELIENSEHEYSQKLTQQVLKLNPGYKLNDELIIAKNQTKTETVKNNITSKKTNPNKEPNKITKETGYKKNQQYFGLATGKEIIKSESKEEEQEVLRILNKERRRKGMQPLIWDENLANAARYHACDMATQNYFEHHSYDIKNGKLKHVAGTFDRIRQFYHDSFVNSENIAAGSKTGEATYKQWYHSKGHYENMFNKESNKVGIGVFYEKDSSYGFYWAFCTAK